MDFKFPIQPLYFETTPIGVGGLQAFVDENIKPRSPFPLVINAGSTEIFTAYDMNQVFESSLMINTGLNTYVLHLLSSGPKELMLH